MKKQFIGLLMAFSLLFSSGQARGAEPETMNVTGKRVKIVAKAALYGFGGGLVVGMASQVFHKKAKNIFLFGSLGMYAGILLGLYVISTSAGPAPYEGPDTYEDFSLGRSNPGLMAKSEALRQTKIGMDSPELQVNLVSLEF